MDVPATLAKMKTRLAALNGKTLQPKDWVEEILLHVMQLEEICLQQQDEINALKRRS